VGDCVLGWCLLFLPVMLTDGPSEKVDKKVSKALLQSNYWHVVSVLKQLLCG
jgi:hypothetical protein